MNQRRETMLFWMILIIAVTIVCCDNQDDDSQNSASDDDDESADDDDNNDSFPSVEYQGVLFGTRLVIVENSGTTEYGLPDQCAGIQKLSLPKPNVLWALCTFAPTNRLFSWNGSNLLALDTATTKTKKDVHLFASGIGYLLTEDSLDIWDGESWESITLDLTGSEVCTTLECSSENDCYIMGQACLYHFLNGSLASESPPDKESYYFRHAAVLSDSTTVFAADLLSDDDYADRFLQQSGGTWSALTNADAPYGTTNMLQPLLSNDNLLVLSEQYATSKFEMFAYHNGGWTLYDDWPVTPLMAFSSPQFGYSADIANELFWIYDVVAGQWFSKELLYPELDPFGFAIVEVPSQ